MPWIRKSARPHQTSWIAAVIAVSAVCVGILIGYTRWGATAAVVNLVEKELTETQARIKTLEKRMTAMESIVLDDELENTRSKKEAGAVRNSEARATKNRFKVEKGKEVWNSESRL
jgi:uncharacterized protein (DUF3084 family)